MRLILYLKAKNDRNGNPRRLFVDVENGSPAAIVSEGYGGTPEAYRGLPMIEVNITTEEYYNWLRWHP